MRPVTVLSALAALAVAGGVLVVWLYARATGFGPLSADPKNWATFGTFVGGVLGPFYAFLALLGLLHSIGLQARELKLTSTALGESAQSQARSVELLARQNELHAASVEATKLSVVAIIAQLEADAIEMESNGTASSGRGTFARDIRGLADDLRAELGLPPRHANVPRHPTL